MPRRKQGLDRHLHVAVPAVFEPDRHGKTRRELAVHLAFDRARPDSTPGDQLRVILTEGCIKELSGHRHAPGGEVDHQLARQSESLVDLKAVVETRVVDQPLPADDRARFLKIDPHDHE